MVAEEEQLPQSDEQGAHSAPDTNICGGHTDSHVLPKSE